MWPAAAVAEPEIFWQATDPQSPVIVAAQQADRWQQGRYEVWHLRGNFYLNQGLTYVRAREAVLWIDRDLPDDHPTKILAYLEGDVRIDYTRSQPPVSGGAAATTSTAPQRATRLSGSMTSPQWFGRFHARGGVRIDVPITGGRTSALPAIVRRGQAKMNPVTPGTIRQTQFSQFSDVPELIEAIPPGTRRVQIRQRSDVLPDGDFQFTPDGRSSIGMLSGGITILIDGVPGIGTLDISTDRVVIWAEGNVMQLGADNMQPDNLPLELYLEGNIVFRQGDTIIHADRMYYDVQKQIGLILSADLLTPVPEYRGLVRLKADAIRILDRSQMVAYGGLLTTSRMGEPSYHFQSGTIAYQDIQQPLIDLATGTAQTNTDGEPLYTHQRLATSSNNFLYVGGMPVLYWPTIATDLQKPTYYINDLKLGNDNIFGTQLMIGLDAYQLLGIQGPEGTEWNVSLDWLDRRGLGHGTTFEYQRDQFLGFDGPTYGTFDAWGIDDHGLDNLGRGRRAVLPDKEYRGRIFWQHRQHLSNTMQVTGQVGLISDNNFLEQYYEHEWDTLNDQTTDLELRQTLDNQSWAVLAGGRVNDFFTQTEWLPRVDHFWLGQPLFGDRLTWFEHSTAAYARLRTATPPPASQMQPFELMPWFAPVEGERFSTRQEIDLPLEIGPAKVVPYALAEFAHWGGDLTGDDLQRFYYQIGARASLPMWRVDPTVCNPILNINGLAHKVVFDAEFSFAESNRDVTMLPLYDPLDDDAIEAFRAQFFSTTYGLAPGAPYPAKYDPRFYAIRSGLGGMVTSPVTEVADDLTILRLGARQRWQTKRGMSGAERIIDWITLDTNLAYYPKEGRDNFGQEFGLANYDFRWHVGDRVTLVSDGGFDFFGGGLRTVSVGGFLNRPTRGNLYLGYRSIAGPVSSDVLAASYAYRMSPKWVSTFGATLDLGPTGNIGESFSITRIGESLLVTVGAKIDPSRGNVSVALLIEPRFLPHNRLKRRHHLDIPSAGAFGLE